MWTWLLVQPVIQPVMQPAAPEQAQPGMRASSDMSPQDRFALRVQQLVLAQSACTGLPFGPK